MKSFTSLLAVAAVASAQSLTDVLRATSNQTSSLAAAVAAVPGLGEVLSNARNITIFAPTNAAFEQFLSANGGRSVLNNTNLVRAVLQYHVLNATVPASAITTTPLFPHTLLDNPTYENVTGGQYLEARASSNGSVGIYSGLGRRANVVTPNVNFTGGIIHLIDQVLTIPQNVTATATNANLTSLASVLTSSGLLGAVNTTPNITIFAPTNAAFSSIQAAIANASNATIQSVLQYHVVPNAVIFSSQLSNGTRVQTLNSAANLTVTSRNGSFFVNGAQITRPNILVANGVVHLIDQVLNPGNTNTSSGTNSSGSAVSTNQFNSSANAGTTGSAATPTGAAGTLKAYPVVAALAAAIAFLL